MMGLKLDGKRVLGACEKQIVFVREEGIWSNIQRSVAKANGCMILKTRWIDGRRRKSSLKKSIRGEGVQHGANGEVVRLDSPD